MNCDLSHTESVSFFQATFCVCEIKKKLSFESYEEIMILVKVWYLEN